MELSVKQGGKGLKFNIVKQTASIGHDEETILRCCEKLFFGKN